MTAIEAVMNELKRLRTAALNGDDADMVRLAKYTLACWPTISAALEEMDRRRIV